LRIAKDQVLDTPATNPDYTRPHSHRSIETISNAVVVADMGFIIFKHDALRWHEIIGHRFWQNRHHWMGKMHAWKLWRDDLPY